jgi:glycosyltransferase involved in cell wall biosynthesis
MSGAVHQFVASLRTGDAVGNTALRLREILRGLGFDSDIFRESCTPDLESHTFPAEEYLRLSGRDRLVIYHYSIGSELNRLVFHLPDRIILCYHNITPPEYFLDIHNHVVGQLYHGRRQLARFADRTLIALGDSEYNRRELEALGFAKTAVLPLALDFHSLDDEPDTFVRAAYSDHRHNFLFVGRIIPNKRIEDLIKLYAFYKKYVSHDSRLLIVGDWTGFERYHLQLLRLIDTIDLPHVVMPGRVNLRSLLAFYSVADVYCSLSEHEGFCAPLLEAMHFDIPVLARAAAAVPETMGGAGVLVKELNYPEIAEILQMLAVPGPFREAILEGQRKRLEEYKKFDHTARLEEIIAAAEPSLKRTRSK